MVARALSLDGTCTGEHGVGIGKIKFLYEEHGEAMSLMRDDQEGARPRQHHEPGQDHGADQLTAGQGFPQFATVSASLSCRGRVTLVACLSLVKSARHRHLSVMALLPPMYTTSKTGTPKPRSKKSKALLKAEAEHARFLKRMGVGDLGARLRSRPTSRPMPDPRPTSRR